MKLPEFFKSSADPQRISLTIKGLIIFVPSIVALGTMFGLSITPETVTEFINQLAVFVGAAMTLYGLFRKLLIKKAQ